FISDKNIIKSIGSNASNPQAIIVIAADYGKMPRGERATTINVSFMTAGSTAQNQHLFATVNNIKMMTEVSFNKTEIQKGLNLPDTVKPLTILSFGYSD
ncbi:MAG: nitroreductase family protein, partial [Calditrichia bacterium]|nr:nitroreductase family protein [Calditrichia bacterium]